MEVGETITIDGVTYKVVAIATSPEAKAHLARKLAGQYDVIYHVSDTEKLFLKRTEG